MFWKIECQKILEFNLERCISWENINSNEQNDMVYNWLVLLPICIVDVGITNFNKKCIAMSKEFLIENQEKIKGKTFLI